MKTVITGFYVATVIACAVFMAHAVFEDDSPRIIFWFALTTINSINLAWFAKLEN